LSTNEVKHHTRRELVDASNYCAMSFLHLNKRGAGKQNVKRGMYNTIVLQASIRFDIPINSLKKDTFKTRIKEGRQKKCAHRGTLSPVTGVEAHLLKCLLLQGTMRQQVSCVEGLKLANSIIDGTG
jgi:hypothetical protein